MNLIDEAFRKWEEENQEKVNFVLKAIKELRVAIQYRINRLLKAKRVKDREERIEKLKETDCIMGIYVEMVSEGSITPESAELLVKRLIEKLVLDTREKVDNLIK